MRRQALIALLILLVGIVIAVLMVRSRPSVEPEPVVQQAPLVQTTPLLRSAAPIEIVETGTVRAQERVNISAQVGGRITSVNPSFVEGGQVKAGDVLIRLDRADFENRVQSAKADLAAQDVAVLQAEEDVAIAKQELAQFDTRFASGPEASASAATSGFRAPDSLATVPSLNANESATPALSEGESRLATREPQLQSAQAARDRAKASLSDAELALSRTIVRAPFSGVIQSENAAVGTVIAAGQALGELIANDVFEVRVSLSDQDAALIPGLFLAADAPIPAKLRTDYAGAQVEWDAKIVRIASTRDSQTRRLDIFLQVENPLSSGRFAGANNQTPAPPLLIGTLVEAIITGQPQGDYALVNADYLRQDNQLWLVEDQKLRIVDTQLITRSDDFAVVQFDALSARQTLVTSDLPAPVDGMAVRVSEAR